MDSPYFVQKCIRSLLLCVLPLAFTAIAMAQGPTGLICNNGCSPISMGGNHCYVSAMCPSPAFPIPVSVQTFPVTNSSAMCAVGAAGDLMATASHLPGSGPNSGTMAACGFSFGAFCQSAGGMTAGLGNYTSICIVNASDGLPVELMEFSLD